jgi:hypothetical protein
LIGKSFSDPYQRKKTTLFSGFFRKRGLLTERSTLGRPQFGCGHRLQATKHKPEFLFKGSASQWVDSAWGYHYLRSDNALGVFGFNQEPNAQSELISLFTG